MSVSTLSVVVVVDVVVYQFAISDNVSIRIRAQFMMLLLTRFRLLHCDIDTIAAAKTAFPSSYQLSPLLSAAVKQLKERHLLWYFRTHFTRQYSSNVSHDTRKGF